MKRLTLSILILIISMTASAQAYMTASVNFYSPVRNIELGLAVSPLTKFVDLMVLTGARLGAYESIYVAPAARLKIPFLADEAAFFADVFARAEKDKEGLYWNAGIRTGIKMNFSPRLGMQLVFHEMSYNITDRTTNPDYCAVMPLCWWGRSNIGLIIRF